MTLNFSSAFSVRTLLGVSLLLLLVAWSLLGRLTPPSANSHITFGDSGSHRETDPSTNSPTWHIFRGIDKSFCLFLYSPFNTTYTQRIYSTALIKIYHGNQLLAGLQPGLPVQVATLHIDTMV